MLILLMLTGILFIRFFDSEVNQINGTMLAFSYKYGFISRGLIGTIYGLLNKILPFDMMNYTWTYRYTFGITIVYYVVLLVFLAFCLKRCKKTTADMMRYLIVFFLMFAVPMFCSEFNFGRLDVYCVMLSFIGALLLIEERFEWLLVPVSALGVMVHQGNVFMFLNIILVLLLYKALSREGKDRKKYLTIFGFCFLTASVLFLWFELFSHVNGGNIYDEIVAKAQLLCKNADYHADVIDHEILGIDLSDREIMWRKFNLIQFPIFIVLMSPYIFMTFLFFRNMFRQAKSRTDKWKYLIVAAGAGTIVPDLLLKADYGRWMFAIICYYCVVILALLAMQDKVAEEQLANLFERMKKLPGAWLLLIYPLLLQPLGDVYICDVTELLGKIIDAHLFHWMG